mgnify:CR=1 FL=1
MASEAWPSEGLESVGHCPYCGSDQRHVALQDVQDWAFGCAPGHWTYWDCGQCQALYLDPRPTESTVGMAYAHYYTHGAAASSIAARMKQRLRNELWFHLFGADLIPRMGFPRVFAGVVKRLQTRIAEPFGLRQIAQLPRGLLVDVGCGNGEKLEIAAQLGWQTLGLELDPSAAQAARLRGLEIREGGYALLGQLGQLGQLADCIVCSHVLEHVHQPLELLQLLRRALKPGGTLLLSTPNARSHLRSRYGRNWRGLEAPRHLAIPAQQWLVRALEAQGFVCDPVASVDLECAVESERISRRAAVADASDLLAARQVLGARRTVPLHEADAIQLVCRLGADSLIKP